MNATETGQIMHILKAAYPMFYAKMPAEEQKQVFGLWLDMFRDDDVRLVGSAVKALIATDTKGFPPVIGQVKEKMRMLTATHELSEAEAWQKVKNALRNSTYGSEDEFLKLPYEVQRVVGSHNQLREWAMMDTETLDSVVASNFQRGFRNIQGREHEMQKLPSSVQSFIGQLAEGMAMQRLPKGDDF